MVAAAQCSHAEHGLSKLDMFGAFQRFIGKILSPAVGGTADGHAAGNVFPDDRVQPLVFCLFCAQDRAGHAASDVDTHESRKQPVPERHGEPDGAGLSRVYVRHDADAAALGARMAAEHLHLCQGILVDGICEYGRRSVSAVYFFHEIPFCMAGSARFWAQKYPCMDAEAP